MPGPRPCHCCPFIFCIVGRGLDPSAGRRGRRPLQCSARLLLVAKGHGGLGAGRPTSHFSTVRRAGCPHPAAASPLPPVFGLFRTKKQGFARSRSPATPLTAMLLFPRQQHRQHGLFHVDAVLRLVENFVGVGFQHIGGDLLTAVGGQRVEFLAKTSATALPCRSFGSTPSLCSYLYSSATSRMCRISSGVMPPSFSRCFIRISPVRCAKSPARRPRRPPSGSAAAADAGGSWRSAPADPPSRRRRGRRRP